MTTIAFDPAAFRLLFPAFSDPTKYPDILLQAWFNAATSFVTKYWNNCSWMTLQQNTDALNYATAHIAALNADIAGGGTPGILTGATIDKVSVQIAEPPVSNQWQYWLASTPYGQMLLALLQIAGVGGRYYVGRRGPPPFRRL